MYRTQSKASKKGLVKLFVMRLPRHSATKHGGHARNDNLIPNTRIIVHPHCYEVKRKKSRKTLNENRDLSRPVE